MRRTAKRQVLGIDVGGSGIKGAVVDVASGRLVSGRYRLATPGPATPKAMARVVARIVRHFEWSGPVGCGMPGPIKEGRVMALANLDKSWIGVKAPELYSSECKCPVTVLNDADAAGLAEMRFGAGKGRTGVVLMLTLGTGIGSAVFVDGRLMPNTELGQIELNGKIAEQRASARARKEKGLTWEKWGKRLNQYLHAVEELVWPDLIILGGGVSKKADKFFPFIKTRAELVAALMYNQAGIVGAALAAGAVRRASSGSVIAKEY
jgi:polyphosphate glucokinase